MRWYVNRGGETGGPFDEGDVRAVAAKADAAGMMVRDEAGGTWMAVEDSPFRVLLPKRLQKRSGRTSGGQLVTLANVFVILIGVGLAYDAVRQAVVSTANAAVTRTDGEFKQSASTSADAAHVTLTNLNSWTMSTCVTAVVTSIKTRTTVRSVPVCTGEVKPRTTVTLEAPYSVGAIKELCPDTTNTFRAVDWDKCTFDLEPMK
jgi:hypothetical protein